MKKIVGYENYEIDEYGNIFNSNGIKMHQFLTYKNYMQISLCKNGKNKTYAVHRLLGLAYIDNPDNKPEINHIDGNRVNNIVENLEWVTHAENMQHSYRVNRRTNCGENNPNAILTEEKVATIRSLFEIDKISRKELAIMFNINYQTVAKIIRNELWKGR